MIYLISKWHIIIYMYIYYYKKPTYYNHNSSLSSGPAYYNKVTQLMTARSNFNLTYIEELLDYKIM